MPKTKSNPWEPIFSRIRAIYCPDWLYPPRTTAADLDDAERELNFRFPAGYRDFAERFGLGGELHTLPEVLPLTPPPSAKKSEWWRSVVDATRFFRSTDWAQSVAPVTFFQRVVVFALDGGYHTFVFDPLEVTSSRLREYRIYDVNRQEEAVAVATSFGRWLEWIDQNYRFEREGEEEEQGERRFPLVYKPDSLDPDPMPYFRQALLRRKKAPGKQSVKRWLAWSDGAVRNLARSIRDEGQADVFPVLADALEEAGCRNVDLLDSCRHGDPDVDGAWVLGVLLGKG